jgi:hypothetical protein
MEKVDIWICNYDAESPEHEVLFKANHVAFVEVPEGMIQRRKG